MTTLTILGTAAPYPRPDHPCSGYLLRAGGAEVWVDAGPGSLAELLRHTTLGALDAVWLSHLHLDHIGDLLNAYYALAYGELPARPPLPVYAPADLRARLAGFFGLPDFANDVLDLRPLSDGHLLQIKDLELTSHAVEHGCEAYALRASANGHTLAYSGDCAPCAGLDAVAANADLLLCEANDPVPTPVHHTPAQTGDLAHRANTKHLVVTHVGPLLDPVAATSTAAEAFGGPTTQAMVRATIPF
ncbi:MBL fold metallo-hydrolase [Kribbella pittospori]|uniref:MBL fold metallo-hydrolase n=1 Tax=Kribbella pittospori TaxID=722689 RepID=A0A4R0JG96_9ACTN|nr:MBL fold metallo-hydrolase [Kribbella pittospori]TCC45499.1 MBL fold metallo-hydrolase [Kribbella pittospori]